MKRSEFVLILYDQGKGDYYDWYANGVHEVMDAIDKHLNVEWEPEDE